MMMLKNLFPNKIYAKLSLSNISPFRLNYLTQHKFSMSLVKQKNTLFLSNRKLFNHVNRYSFSTDGKRTDVSQEFKNQSKQFYSKYVDDIIELEKSSDWMQVIQTVTVPLVIDFYADWCGPCKKLTPMLQQRINKANGKYKLLKVNIDKCGQLATQLQIKSVPTVYFVFMGQGIDSFQGMVDEARLDKSFQALQKISQIANKEQKAYITLEAGKQLMRQEKYAQAEQIFSSFDQKGISQELIALKEVLLSQVLLVSKKVAKFKDQIQKMKKIQHYYLQNPQLKEFYELMKAQCENISKLSNQNPVIAALKQKIQAQPNNLYHKFELVQQYKTHEMMEESLELAIQIIKANKQWQQKKANKFILGVFKQLGNASPLTQKYRKILQRVMH